jgi:hypothetical protein
LFTEHARGWRRDPDDSDGVEEQEAGAPTDDHPFAHPGDRHQNTFLTY